MFADAGFVASRFSVDACVMAPVVLRMTGFAALDLNPEAGATTPRVCCVTRWT
jgi:hypothetical protein